jgi:hypothetical protein
LGGQNAIVVLPKRARSDRFEMVPFRTGSKYGITHMRKQLQILFETVLFQICPEYTLQKRRFLKCQCYNIHNVLELAGVKLDSVVGFKRVPTVQVPNILQIKQLQNC